MAIVRYAGNRMTGLSTDTKPTESSLITGTTFQETNTDDLYVWTGSGWNIVASNTGTETFANKTLQAPRITLSAVLMEDTTILFEGSTDDSNDTTLIFIDTTANRTVSLPDATGTVSLITGTETLTNKTLTSPVINTSISGSAFLDEDNFASDAADKVASQQSIKAYVASQVPGSQNVFNTIAVSGQDNVVADSATDTLTFVAGTGMTITTTAGSDSVTFTNSATASLAGLSDTDVGSPGSAHILVYDGTNSWDNKAISGDVTIATTGAVTIAANAVEGSMLNSNTAGTGLSYSSNALQVDAAQTQITSVGALDTGSITSGFTSIDVGAGAISTTGTITAGNLVVTGDTTTVNTATVTVEDPLMILASGNNAADAVDIGFYGLYDTSGSQDLYSGLFRDANDSGKWKLFKDLQAAPTTTVNTNGNGYAVGTLVANVEGNVTGSSGSTTGNAATVTNGVYTTGNQTINGTKTFGSTITGNISGNAGGTAATVTGGTQAAITAAANLVTVGTIGTGVWQGTAIAQAYVADQAINEAKLQVSNGPSDGYVLTARSGNAGGMTWEASSSSGASESFAIAMAVAL